MKKWSVLFVMITVLFACKSKNDKDSDGYSGATYTEGDEPHLSNLRQLTYGGDNAEAYFSFDDSKLVFQSNNPAWGLECDQIFWMDIDEAIKDTLRPPMISNGLGRTTCSYFLPGDSLIVFASTHEGGDECPEETKDSTRYLWSVFGSYDIYVADLEGNIVSKLTDEPGYDAEATVSPDGKKIVFTSDRSGDLELYTMDLDGSNVVQVTSGLGYDGGAFFSPNSQELIFRSSRPTTDEEVADYKDLLSRGLVAPTNMELYICNVDGSNLRQITELGQANWAPFFHPSGEKVIFSSNHASEKGFPFQLYMIDTTGENLTQITTQSVFNAFPMFSRDGKQLVFSSNRDNGGTRETNLFIADWVEEK